MEPRKIRVLYIQHHGTAGGAPRSLIYLIKGFPAGAVEPFILTPEGTVVNVFKQVTENVFTIPEVPEITSIAGGKYYYQRLLKTIWNHRTLTSIDEHLSAIKPDIVHLNDLSMSLIARLCRKRGYKVLVHARVVLNDGVPLLNWALKRAIYRYADVVVAIDGSVAAKLEGVRNLHIIYNPLHAKDLSTDPPASDRPARPCNVLFLANLITYKGIFDLLEAVIILKEEKDSTHVIIAGANSRPQKFFETLKGKLLKRIGIVRNVAEEIDAIIKKYKLENVSFVGHVSDINSVLKKTDVLVFPSHMNGPSRSIFEAGAMGIPSIMALKDKVEDVVQDGVNGLIIPERSPKALAQAILTLSKNPEMRARLGANAKSHFAVLNDPQRSANSMLGLYRKMLGIS